MGGENEAAGAAAAAVVAVEWFGGRDRVWITGGTDCDPPTQNHAGGTPAPQLHRPNHPPLPAFSQHFGKSPDKLGQEHLRSYQAHVLRQRKLSPGSVEHRICALRFFFVRTLHRHEYREFLPYPKARRKLPNILSGEEITQLIEASNSLFKRTLLAPVSAARSAFFASYVTRYRKRIRSKKASTYAT